MSSLRPSKMKKPAELVFIPFTGVGHLVSTVEIAKLLVSRDDHLFITVLIMKSPFHSKLGTNAYVESIEAPSQKRIKFINLPESNLDFTNKTLNAFRKELMESHKPYVRDASTELAGSTESAPRIAGIVIDMFCTTMIDVANEFGVPTYIFFISNAGFLALMLNLQTIHDEHDVDVTEFKKLGNLVGPVEFHQFGSPQGIAKYTSGEIGGNHISRLCKKVQRDQGYFGKHIVRA